MLSGIRGAAETWLGKVVLTILFAFLIVSFAIWGIGDLFRQAGGNSALASVGRTDITAEAFRRVYQQRILEIQQRSRGFTSDQARAIGLDRQVLNQMISETALDENARRLGLAISTEDVARSLASNTAFKAADGRFSRPAFDAYLRDVGLTEGAFLQQQRQATLRQQIGEAVSGGFSSPVAVLEMLHRYRAEERSVQYIVIPGAIASALPAPTDEALKALHEQRKAAFRAPEYRAFNALVLSPSEFASEIQVSDAELRQAYDRGVAASRFGTPEKRQIQQIVFPNSVEATAAAERLKGGLTWEALLEERKLKASDADIGLKARAELPDRALAEAAFALAKDAISAPVQGPFGTVILRVVAIDAGTSAPFETVKEALRAEVAAGKLTGDGELRRKIDGIHDHIEELRSSGKSLQQVADELKRPLTAISAADAQGRDKAGEAIKGIPDTADVLKAVFLSERGVDNEAIRTREGGYVWFEIQSIERGRERTFDEVRAQVDEAWRNDEAARLTNQSANEYLKRVEAGEKLEAIATELGVSVETAQGVTRNGNDAVGPSAAATAFALTQGKFAVASTGRGADRMILTVDGIAVPPFNPEDPATKSLKSQLDTTISGEWLGQYAARVQSSLGVLINDRALTLATGAPSQR
jgi:peptidyl-prolyl cis-trans isomerase D